MRIAIIGTGNVGRALARGWARAGHGIIIGTRNPGEPGVANLARQIRAETAAPSVAAAAGEVVTLALPWSIAEAAVKALGELSGKIVIDCMNPLAVVGGVIGLDRSHGASGAEAVAGWLPGARVVKTLNQVGHEVMSDNARMAHRPVMFMAGDDDAAKAAVGHLLTDLGLEPLDAGDLAKARLLEPFAMVWINQALARGKGRAWAFAAVHQN